MAEARPRKGKGKPKKRLGHIPETDSTDTDKDTNNPESDDQNSDVALPNEPLDDENNRENVTKMTSPTDREAASQPQHEASSSSPTPEKREFPVLRRKGPPPLPAAAPTASEPEPRQVTEVVAAEELIAESLTKTAEDVSAEPDAVSEELAEVPLAEPVAVEIQLEDHAAGERQEAAADAEVSAEQEVVESTAGAEEAETEPMADAIKEEETESAKGSVSHSSAGTIAAQMENGTHQHHAQSHATAVEVAEVEEGAVSHSVNGGSASSMKVARDKGNTLPDLPDIPLLPPTRKSSTLDSLFDDDLSADAANDFDEIGADWEELRPEDDLSSLLGGADDFDVESLLAQHEAEAKARAAAKNVPPKPAAAVPGVAANDAAPASEVTSPQAVALPSASSAPMYEIDAPANPYAPAESVASVEDTHPLLISAPHGAAEAAAPIFTIQQPAAASPALPALPQGLTAAQIAAEAETAKRDSAERTGGTDTFVIPEVPVAPAPAAVPVPPAIVAKAPPLPIVAAPVPAPSFAPLVAPPATPKGSVAPPSLPPALPDLPSAPPLPVVEPEASEAEDVAVDMVEPEPPAAPPVPLPPVVPAFKPDIFHKAPEEIDVESLLISEDDDASAPGGAGSIASSPLAKSAGASFFSDKVAAGRLASGTSVGSAPDHIPQLPEIPVHGAPHIAHSEGFTPEEVNAGETVEELIAHTHTPPTAPAEVLEAPEPEVFLPPALPEPETELAPVPEPETALLPPPPPEPVAEAAPVPEPEPALAVPVFVAPELPPVPAVAQVSSPQLPVPAVADAAPVEERPDLVVPPPPAAEELPPVPVEVAVVADAPAVADELPVLPPVPALQCLAPEAVTEFPPVPAPAETPVFAAPEVLPPVPAPLAEVVDVQSVSSVPAVPEEGMVALEASPFVAEAEIPQPEAPAIPSSVPAVEGETSVEAPAALPPLSAFEAPALPEAPPFAARQALEVQPLSEAPVTAEQPSIPELPAFIPAPEEGAESALLPMPPAEEPAVAPAEAALPSLPPGPTEEEPAVAELLPPPPAFDSGDAEASGAEQVTSSNSLPALPPVPLLTPEFEPEPEATLPVPPVFHDVEAEASVQEGVAEELPSPSFDAPATPSGEEEQSFVLPPPPLEMEQAVGAHEFPAFPSLPPPVVAEEEANAFEAPALPPVPVPLPVPEFGEADPFAPPLPPMEETGAGDLLPPLPPPPPAFDEVPAGPNIPGLPPMPVMDAYAGEASQLPPLPSFTEGDAIPALPPLPAEMGVVPPDPLQELSGRGTLRTGAEPTKITRLSRKPEQLLTRRKGKTLTGGTSFGRIVDPETGEPLTDGPSDTGAPTEAGVTPSSHFTKRAGGLDTLDTRGKMAAPRELAGSRKVRTAELEPKQELSRAKVRLWLFARVIVVALVAAVCMPLYLGSLNFLQETRVDGVIIPPPDTAKITEIYIVDDFMGEIADLRASLRAQRQPLLESMQKHIDTKESIKREIDAKEEQVQRWIKEIEVKQQELKEVAADVVRRRNEIWKGPGSNLGAEYDRKLNALRAEIKARADGLNLTNFKGTEEFPSPDVWINAFSLALYDAPKNINVAQEKEWGQKKLTEWRNYVKEYEEQTARFTEDMRALEGIVGPKNAEVTQLTEDLKAKIAEAQQTIGPLKDEMLKVDVELTAYRDQEARQDQDFTLELLAIPQRKIKRSIPVLDNRFTLRNLQHKETGRMNEWEPGTYRAFIRIKANSEEYWAIDTFDIVEHQATQVVVPPSAFVPVLQILKADVDSDPVR